MKKKGAAGRSFFAALTAMLLSALLFLTLCFVLHITPFGDRTFLYEDMKQQYVDFFSYYHNVWHGKDGFAFSYNCGLGSEMFGIWAYYLMSPFLLMFAMIPAIHYATAVTFLIMMKMSAMAFCMSLLFSHISKRYRGLNIILSVAFAFSGWTVANMTNIMWLDAVILLPIVVLGFDMLVHRQKYGLSLYVISVMAMIVVNYYIAAMVLMFLGLFAVLEVLFMKKSEEHNNNSAESEASSDSLYWNDAGFRGFLRFMGGSLLAILLDLWFLVPTVISLMGSNKDHSEVMTEAFEKYLPSSEAIARNLNPISVLPKLFAMSYDSMEIMEGLPNIYFGAALIVPCVLFFLNKRINARVRGLFGAFLILITAFFCVKPLNTLAHGGTEAYGYLYRYSFVFSFVCLIMVFMCLINEGGASARKAISAEIITLILFGIVVLGKVRFLSGTPVFVNFILIVTGGCVVLSLAASKGKARQYALPLLGLILAADLSLNFICVYRSSSMNAETVSGYMAKCQETELALAEIEELENAGKSEDTDSLKDTEKLEGTDGAENGEKPDDMEELEKIEDLEVAGADTVDDSNNVTGQVVNVNSGDSYRIESLRPRTPNDSLHYDYRGTTSYNSLLKVENRLLMYKLGFNDNGLYTMYEAGNTKCADAILGVKYLIANCDEVKTEIESNGLQEIVSDDLIRNKYVLSADCVNDESVPQLLELIDATDNPFDAQETIWKHFTGSEDEIFVKDECQKSNSQDDGDSYSFTVVPGEDGDVYFYMNRDNTNERSLEIWCDGEFISGYGNASCQKVIDLGYHKKGEEINLEIRDADGFGGLPSEPIVVTENSKKIIKFFLK